MQRLEHKFLLSSRQCFQVFHADQMGLRDMAAQDLTLARLNPQLFVPIRPREPFQQPFVAARGIGKGIWRDMDPARVIGRPQRREIFGLPEEIGRAVDDEAYRASLKQQLLALPAKLCRTSELGLPAALAQQIAEQLEFFPKFAALQRFGVVEDEKQTCRAFSEKCPALPLHHADNVLVECRHGGWRRYAFLPPQACCLVVHSIDDRGEYETRPVVVELDQFPAAPRRKMKIPGAEKTN